MKITRIIYRFIAVLAIVVFSLPLHAADWTPSGPIKLWIGFRAGGGVDTQARLIAEELEARHGWKIIPENLPGAGGMKLGKALPKEPNDGLSIGFLVTETLGYNMMAAKDPGFSLDDFTYLTATTGSQMSLYTKSTKGWKSLDDMLAAAKAWKSGQHKPPGKCL